MDLDRVMGRLQDFLDAEGVPVALVGAHAFQAYGVTRATVDLDLLTEDRVQERLLAFLESLGYETLHRSPGYSNHLHADPAWVRIDFVYVDERTSRALFARATRTASIGGRQVKVPGPEHLVAMKVQAVKNDPRRTFKDLADVQELLRVTEVDDAEVRAYFEGAGLGARYEEIRRNG
jgi:Nucleotidyl transferase AbiEii toxin, Type IV TA system